MDTRTFFATLPEKFTGDVATSDPIDPRWQELTEQVAGYTAVSELAVLNHAAALLPDDEAYLEVGTFKGRSIVAAAANNPGATFIAMENFMEFGMAGQEARDELMHNLRTYTDGAHLNLLEGDCFALMARPDVCEKPVGVYFYDGEHTLLSHYLALAVVEPLLADEALILIDDASWPVVQKAHRLFVKNHPGWEVSATWDAAHADDPRWANGLHALTFRRAATSGGATRGTTRGLSRRDEALRQYQVHVQDRVNTVAWKIAGLMPGTVTRIAALVLGRSRKIDSSQDA